MKEKMKKKIMAYMDITIDADNDFNQELIKQMLRDSINHEIEKSKNPISYEGEISYTKVYCEDTLEDGETFKYYRYTTFVRV